MPPRQQTFELIPTTLVRSNGAKPPMTSKAAKKAYAAANRGPRISRAEQRKRDAEELARQKREYEKERALTKARAAREKKAAKEAAEREERRRNGIPEPSKYVRASQPTISMFVRGNGNGKRTWKRMEGVVEDSEGTVTDGEASGRDEAQPPPKRVAIVEDSEDDDDEFGDFPAFTQCDFLEKIVMSGQRTSVGPISPLPNKIAVEVEVTESPKLPKLPAMKAPSNDNEFGIDDDELLADMVTTQLLSEAAEAASKSDAVDPATIEAPQSPPIQSIRRSDASPQCSNGTADRKPNPARQGWSQHKSPPVVTKRIDHTPPPVISLKRTPEKLSVPVVKSVSQERTISSPRGPMVEPSRPSTRSASQKYTIKSPHRSYQKPSPKASKSQPQENSTCIVPQQQHKSPPVFAKPALLKRTINGFDKPNPDTKSALQEHPNNTMPPPRLPRKSINASTLQNCGMPPPTKVWHQNKHALLTSQNHNLPPSSTQLFLENHLDDFFPTPTQEIRELLDDIDVDDLPSNTQIALELSSPIKPSERIPPKRSPKFQQKQKPIPSLKLPSKQESKLVQQDHDPNYADLFCTQDLELSPQDIAEITAPSPIRRQPKPAHSHPQTQTKQNPPVEQKKESPPRPRSKGRFFQEKEEDLVAAALHESKLLALAKPNIPTAKTISHATTRADFRDEGVENIGGHGGSATTSGKPSRGRFFQEKEEDLLAAAIHESKLLAEAAAPAQSPRPRPQPYQRNHKPKPYLRNHQPSNLKNPTITTKTPTPPQPLVTNPKSQEKTVPFPRNQAKSAALAPAQAQEKTGTKRTLKRIMSTATDYGEEDFWSGEGGLEILGMLS